MHFPCLFVCPRIVIHLARFEWCVRRDKHVDTAFRSVLHPYCLCYPFGAKRFLRLGFIHLAIYLDMQMIFHVGNKGTNPTDVSSIGLLRVKYRAVAPAYGDFRPPCHSRLAGRVDGLRKRQDELIMLVRTYRAFHYEQIGILFWNVCFKFFNTARKHAHADHQA